jgi:hypothetical protein
VRTRHGNSGATLKYKNGNFVFPTVDILENTQRYYEMFLVLLPICTITTAVKRCDSIAEQFLGAVRFHFSSLLSNCMSRL